jgi:hypothetical protein
LKAVLWYFRSREQNGGDGRSPGSGGAQNKSLLIFAGETYNVEQGVTNELFRKRGMRPRMPFPALQVQTHFAETDPAAAFRHGEVRVLHAFPGTPGSCRRDPVHQQWQGLV